MDQAWLEGGRAYLGMATLFLPRRGASGTGKEIAILGVTEADRLFLIQL